MNNPNFIEDTKNLYNEMMEIPRGVSRLWKTVGWGLLIPILFLLGFVALVINALYAIL